MDKKYYDNLIVSASPHLVTAMDTQKTMLMVLIALVPSLLVSTYVFGFRVLILTAVCIAADGMRPQCCTYRNIDCIQSSFRTSLLDCNCWLLRSYHRS